jgi:hypothetical protein
VLSRAGGGGWPQRTTNARSALAVGLEEYRDIRADVKLQPDLYGTEVYHKTSWVEAN